MSGQLDGLRLWVTRPEPAADRSARRFENEGARCVVVPTVRLEPVPLGEPDRRRLREALPGARLVLTSANAVRFLLEAVEDDPQLRERVRSAPASAVGEATAQAARVAGLQVDHIAARALGRQLAAELVQRDGLSTVVLPGSDLRREEVERILQVEGVRVLALTVYHTRPVETLAREIVELLDRGEIDLAAVYSPSAATGLGRGLRSWESARSVPCAALGPTTARALRNEGLPVAVLGEAVGEEALVEAVARWWSRERGER